MTWRNRIRSLVQRYEAIYFYTADPGATATLRPIYEEAHKEAKAQTWFVEGWAAHAYLPNSEHIVENHDFLQSDNMPLNSAVLMGQQVNFSRAYDRLKYFQDKGIETIFISDHWKDISRSFKKTEVAPVVFPDYFYVPDTVAYEAQLEFLSDADLPVAEMETKMNVFIHPGIEHSLERILALKSDDMQTLRDKYEAHDEVIVMMLDVIQESEKEMLGYDWRSALTQAIEHFKAHCSERTTLLVKPHPRQDVRQVEQFLACYRADSSIRLVDEPEGEAFVRLANEVWGITTVLLVVALKMNKPIKVFMPGRTEKGRKESNAYIESYWIK